MSDIPILTLMIFIPLIGVLFLLFIKGDTDFVNKTSSRVAMLTSIITFFASILILKNFNYLDAGFQFVEQHDWIVDFVNYKVGIDGISLSFILLTTFITPICILATINSVRDRLREFLITLLLMETMMIGVFCSLDLFIFYLFFEAGLIPMFLIIGIWGGEKRVYSAFKFFLYTLFGSIFMLVAIIYIYIDAGTLDVEKLLNIEINKDYQKYLWLGFFASFAVKTPMWPVHTWLPDAHVEAPTSGSVILAAILLKMAGYGFIRFSLGLFPDASIYFAPFVFILSVIAIIYTSLVALVQNDMKKLIAYSSVAHMGFVTIGIFVFNKQGIEGSIFQMISHGIISSALFLCVGVIYDRMRTREISHYGGVVNSMPKYATLFMIFTLGSLGLPGTSGFIGEILVLIGAFKFNYWVAFFATIGVVLSACYSLWLYKRVIFGEIKNDQIKNLTDLNKREYIILTPLVIMTLVLGFYPGLLLDLISSSAGKVSENMINYMNISTYIK
ncbi:MAG: NADH-quinone oxidoreductase subunit M [Candidatus Pelagibacter sp.]|nr:NADH-quinone oxidoreductase subunit M [Candidatus Pelagibacter sp.]OUV87313.1 MAG: NADH-quinone oxidoreductase subunit M [Pelagibacteraceae bacterium TMED136]|tara:strand:+ start:21440 stop:22939 length:1500 start_codon:yes stop_codon:yes gene_type:complete